MSKLSSTTTCRPSLPSTFIVLVAQLVLERRDGKYRLIAGFRLHANPKVVNSSITLVGEADRKMLKAAIKHSSGEDQVRHRIVPAETIQQWVEKLENLKSEIAEIMAEEKEEKHVSTSDFSSLSVSSKH